MDAAEPGATLVATMRTWCSRADRPGLQEGLRRDAAATQVAAAPSVGPDVYLGAGARAPVSPRRDCAGRRLRAVRVRP